MFGHDTKDGFLVEPLAEAGPSWVLMGVEPQTSSLHLTSTYITFQGQKCSRTHTDKDVHWAAVRLPVRVKGHNPDLDLLTGLIGVPVRLDESGKALGVQVKLSPVDEHHSPAIVAVDLQYQRMPVGSIVHMDLQR